MPQSQLNRLVKGTVGIHEIKFIVSYIKVYDETLFCLKSMNENLFLQMNKFWGSSQP